MVLRSKILITLLSVVVLYAALDYAIHRWVIFPSFTSLEQTEAQKDLERCVEALRREIHHLDQFTNDWAAWDDTYRFIEDRNNDYIVSNLGPQTFLDSNLNVICLITLKGRIVWSEVRDLESGEGIQLLDFSHGFLPTDHPLLQHRTSESSVAGVYMTNEGPMLVASRPVISSTRQGPIRGSLIMGRFISEVLIAALVEQTRVDHQFWPVTDNSIPTEARNFLDQIKDPNPLLVSKHSDRLDIFTTFPDLRGDPALLIRATVARDISTKGTDTMRYAVVSNLIVGIILLIVLLGLLQRIIVKPVSDLTRHAVTIRDNTDLSLRFDSNRYDEIGALSREFDRMVCQLQESRQSLEMLVEKRTADLSSANQQLRKEIGDRQRAEDNLRQARDDLEKQVATRTAELTSANIQLKREIEERRQAEIELNVYHEKLRSLSSELLLTEERERHRIATELHDRIGQALSISKIQLDALIESATSPSLSVNLTKISELFDQIIQDTRHLTFELSPPVLYELGLEAALEWLAEQIQEQHGLAITFEDDMQSKPLDNGFRVLIFQASREVLFNVVKHAQAQKVTVSVQRKGEHIQIDIQDDGIGFDPSAISFLADKKVGFGLFSIRERLRHLGGHLAIESTAGKGTRVTLVSPMQDCQRIQEELKGI